MNDVLIIILMVIVFLAAVILLPQFFIKRAIRSVIRIFRRVNALDPKSARTVEELGLKQPSFIDRMWRLRDYKPQALQLLMRIEIVRMTEDGKLYLSEEKLSTTPWK